MGRYGQIPTDLFNGLPQITIPLHLIKIKDIEVPVQLSYYASGIKLQQRPTWVGLGWSLSCGGSITRVIRGLKDETNNEDVKRETNYGFIPYGFGYFYRSNTLDRTDWTSMESLISFLPAGETSQSTYADGDPDEFMVSAPGVSASFYLYRDAADNVKIKVKSKDGRKISVKSEIPQYLNIDFYDDKSGIRTPTMYGPFYKFTVTTEDGKIYTFGGQPNAVEFDTDVNSGYMVSTPVTWYLTNITSVLGSKINFNYKRDGNPIFTSNVTAQTCITIKGGKETVSSCGLSDRTSLSTQNPIYLSDVSGSDGTQIDFVKSQALDLKEPFDAGKFQALTHISPTVFNAQDHWMKLDEIVINRKKRIKLNYTENVNQRLKLNGLTITDLNNNPGGNYSFTYNPRLLPSYNSKMADNWGYYNGKKYEGVSAENLYAYRSADTALMKAEVLTAIRYPTGGATFFQYEAHDYSQIASQFPDFKLNPANGFAGGLRIRKIISRPEAGSPDSETTKEYLYLNEDNSSSGILSGVPLYGANGRMHVKYHYGGWSGLTYYSQSADNTQNYITVSENFVNQLGNTNGSHITYSRVVEKTIGNGKIVYKYTNHDLFPDLVPLYTYTNMDSRTLTDAFTSRELERGLLIKQETYDEGNNPVETITNEYNSFPERYNDFVKAVSKFGLVGLDQTPFTRINANRIFTFYPYLQKKTVTNYSPSIISKSTEYTYDNSNNGLSSIISTNSKGYTSTTTYNYPGNLKESSATYKKMYEDKHIISPVIEERNVITKAGSSTVIPASFQRNNYVEVGKDIFMPGSVEQSIGSYPVETLTDYTYDNKGNVSGKSTRKGPNTSYIWGYADQFPIAIIENANGISSGATISSEYRGLVIKDNSNSASTAFSTTIPTEISLNVNGEPGLMYTLDYTLLGPVSQSGSLCISRTSRTCYYPSSVIFNNMPAGNYTLTIRTSGSEPAGTYRSLTLRYNDKVIANKGINEFYYEGFEENQLSNVVTGAGHTGNKYWNGNYTPEFSQPGGRNYIIQWWNYNGSKWVFNQQAYTANLTLTGPVDDVRIFPTDAKMTTYTYDPQVGMTSQTDEKGKSVYYIYDGLQRLIMTKDQNWEIVKSNSYHFKN
ncbi:hypothetical protein TH53_24130 [Pedobacter lusitanus]|uniref:YD repeat-containing protein n=1 Tax=Pedobacter lusitanus TaxID=1503925 RepID=A0A0D0GFE4_9SPHI|nr:hypothetical protein [Pedobacter lusitanus]KIO74850.1 hypothetical protein TH53_24130 [Pedobacter lusitanus]